MGPATDRVALIRYTVDGERRVGSGLWFRDRFLLTADHCATGSDHTAEFSDGSKFHARVHVRTESSDVDLAVLELDGVAPPVVPALRPARVDRAVAAQLHGCVVLGFPRWRRDKGGDRVLAQVDGYIPTAEGLRVGPDLRPEFLEFKATGPGVQDHPTSPGELTQASPWGGMSGAGVVKDNTVVGVIRSHNIAAGTMSLTITPLDAIDQLPADRRDTFREALGPGGPEWITVPDRLASLYQGFLAVLTDTGRPPRVREADLGSLGVRQARTDIDLHGNEYYPYVHRTIDNQIATALDRRAQGTDRRILLVVGEAMTGKTRTTAENLQQHEVLRDWTLLVPREQNPSLDQIVDLVEHDRATLWLDDLNEYLPSLDESLARRWQNTHDLVVIATIRRGLIAAQQGSADLRRKWEFLNDDTLVERVEMPSEWSEEDQRNLQASDGWVKDQVAHGTPLGEFLGAAPELRRLFQNVPPAVRGLVELVIDWHRTGIPRPLEIEKARLLWPEYLPRRDRADLHTRDESEAEQLFAAAQKQASETLTDTHAAMVFSRWRTLWAEPFLIGMRESTDAAVKPQVWAAALNRALQEIEHTPGLLHAVGDRAAISGRYDVAQRAMRLLAEAGDAGAQYNLGVLFATESDPPDLDEARHWWTLAAEAGYTSAQYNLGLLFSDVLDPPDLDEARHWWTLAAEAGEPSSQHSLGLLFSDVLDPPDLEQARHWYTAAANAGHIPAQVNLGLLLANRLDPPDIEGARYWFTQAAEAGAAPAQYNLAFLLANQIDPPDIDQAQRWLTIAARAGDTDAQYALGVLFAAEFEPPDFEQARYWYTQAAEAGDTGAQFDLAVLLATQFGDLAQANYWRKKAAEGGLLP